MSNPITRGTTTGRFDTMTEWQNHVFGYSYDDDDGMPTRIDRSGGEYSTKGYDDAGRLTSLSYVDNTDVALAEFGYELDENGNREAVDIIGSALTNGTENYTYDELDRLDDAAYLGGGYVEFGYDPNGNRTTVTTSSLIITCGDDTADQLQTITGGGGPSIAPDDDPNGNLIDVFENSVQTRELTWDWADRMTQAMVGSSPVANA